jgi:hypothetical protein
MSDVRCTGCHSVVAATDIDWDRELASCSRCGRLTDLRRTRVAKASAAAAPARARDRVPSGLPDGMGIDAGRRVVIRRRWLRAKHWFLLCLFGGAGLYVAYLWATAEPSGWLVAATLFVASWNYNLLAAFVNTTVVTGAPDGVTVRHGPLPSLFARPAEVAKADIEQLFSTRYGVHFAVAVKPKAGGMKKLVAPLVTAEQAIFVERELERALGLADAPVPGELGADGETLHLEGKRPAGASSGAGFALGVPLLIAGMLGLFFVMTKTEVSGRLRASGPLGSWTFAPDDCSSGQREGFGGVVLTAEKDRGVLVRVVQDPVRGKLVVVAAAGRPNHVIDAAACSRFDVSVIRTSTSVNDVWAIDGKLALECRELSGAVSFEGCH